jgi:hypothetical protein
MFPTLPAFPSLFLPFLSTLLHLLPSFIHLLFFPSAFVLTYTFSAYTSYLLSYTSYLLSYTSYLLSHLPFLFYIAAPFVPLYILFLNFFYKLNNLHLCTLSS